MDNPQIRKMPVVFNRPVHFERPVVLVTKSSPQRTGSISSESNDDTFDDFSETASSLVERANYQGSFASLNDSFSDISREYTTSRAQRTHTAETYTPSDGNADDTNKATRQNVPKRRSSVMLLRPRRRSKPAAIATISEMAEVAKEAEITEARKKAVEEATQFLQDFIQNNWWYNFSQGGVKIHCDLTIDQLANIGRMNQAEGLVECGKLLKAPVIHDAVVYSLWKELSERAAPRDAPIKLGVGPATPMMSNSEVTEQRGVKLTLDTTPKGLTPRPRSLSRRVSLNDLAMTSSRPSSSSGKLAAVPEEERRKSDVGLAPLVRADSVMCTTCGSRAVGDYRRKSDGNVPENGEEDGKEEVKEEGKENTKEERYVKDTRRSRRLFCGRWFGRSRS
ncbi:hypothetical protein CSOJ01_10222 [Colletotrichum sojae]|uniref:Uncharacterized protein n=1 Tax=Colletotrichum sojae TaxID=2175907 RepID=A0A8H6J0W0_9PEZI|nr:hypothetical protein CSOJ01_10222 [Colletotrichum sojae]